MPHLTMTQLEDGETEIAESPTTNGTVEMIVCRPVEDGRTVLTTATFSVGVGLVGDNYVERGSTRTPDKAAHPEAQVTLMNSRSIDLICQGDKDQWPLAGDQLFVDFDLSLTNLPTGSRLAIGSTVLEVTAKPHTGCAKFAQRFGLDAAKWANSSSEHRYRGINAAVIQEGTVTVGDTIRKL